MKYYLNIMPYSVAKRIGHDPQRQRGARETCEVSHIRVRSAIGIDRGNSARRA